MNKVGLAFDDAIRGEATEKPCAVEVLGLLVVRVCLNRWLVKTATASEWIGGQLWERGPQADSAGDPSSYVVTIGRDHHRPSRRQTDRT